MIKISPKIKSYFTKDWFTLCTLAIIGVASFLRFYDFQRRYILSVDQASFTLLARYALFNHKLPLLGQFTSAGPFQAGGEWYWFLMFAQSLWPYSLLTPWVVLVIFYIFFVLLIVIFGKKLLGKTFAIIVGILAAVSPSQIGNGFNLSNQSPLPVFTLLAIWCSFLYLKKKKTIYIFLLGLLVGLAPTFHPQGFTLMFLLFFTLIFSGIPNISGILLLLIGLFIPWIPIFIADSQNHFFNTRNMIEYYIRGQQKIPYEALGRRWLTYTFNFWPQVWGYIIGGNIFIGYLIIVLTAGAVIFSGLRKKISKEWMIIILSLIAIFVLLRYTRTPLFDSYLLTIHPFVLLLTGWTVFTIYTRKAILGMLLLLLIVGGSFLKISEDIKYASGNGVVYNVKVLMEELTNEYPNSKFAIYDYGYKNAALSYPLVLFLDEKNHIDDNGVKVGVIVASKSAQLQYPVIYGKQNDVQLVNLSRYSNEELISNEWRFMNPSAVYHRVQEWYKDE